MIQDAGSLAAPPFRFRSRALARANARLNRRAITSDTIAIGEISDRLEQMGPLYLMMMVACICVSPLSGIPFVTTACGLSIAALSVQVLLRKRTVWLPGALRRREVRVDRLMAGLRRADRVAGFLEAALSRRMVWLTRGVPRAALLCLCIVIGLKMPLMEVIPFGGTTLASVVLLIALSLVTRDGLMALGAVAVLGTGMVFGISLFS